MGNEIDKRLERIFKRALKGLNISARGNALGNGNAIKIQGMHEKHGSLTPIVQGEVFPGKFQRR